MKILIKIIKIAFIVVLGVSLSYILTSCKNDSFVQGGNITVDIINAEPSVLITGNNYSSSSIKNIKGLAERNAAFQHAYKGKVTASLKESIEELIGITIDNSGGNGKSFRQCSVSIELAEGKDCLACFVESAKFEGKDSWIISYAHLADNSEPDNAVVFAVEKSTGKVLYGKA